MGTAAGGDQPGIISTVAGTGEFVTGDGGPALEAGVGYLRSVAVDGSGNLYLSDPGNHRVRRVDRAGVITTVAGTGVSGYGGDGGVATAAQLASPRGLAVDGSGNLYIADTGNRRVRRVDLLGTITTVAGNGEHGFGGDGGPATAAQFSRLEGLAVDGVGNLYIVDAGNHRVRKVDRAGVITAVAGTGVSGYGGDGGAATAAQLASPRGLAVDGSGNLYIADAGNRRVRRVDPFGTITTVAGTGEPGSSGDGGAATAAQLGPPRGLAMDSSGNLYIAESNLVRRVDRFGVITTVAGTGEWGSSGDGGPATAAQLIVPQGLAVDAAGSLYIADFGNRRVRIVDQSGRIATVAGNGNGRFGGDGGPADSARLFAPSAVALDKVGNLYLADRSNHRVRKVDRAGVITTVAGDGTAGDSGDGGPATGAQLHFPGAIAVDGSGNLYLADEFNRRVRRVDPLGTITTVAGTGERGYSGDGGPAAAAQLDVPTGLAVDGSGNLYVADRGNDRVRRVDPAGTITTVAGNGSPGFGGDGGAATAAQLDAPSNLALDAAGNLYIADGGNHRVRRVDLAGTIITVAGDGSRGFGGDGGAATAAQLLRPSGLALDGAGNLYIADGGNHRVRRVDTAGIITSVAGDGNWGFGGDGSAATSAQIANPRGVAVDGVGNLYIADSGNHRIRRVVQPGLPGGGPGRPPGDPPPGTVRDEIAPGVFIDFELVPAEQPFYMGRHEVTRDQWLAVMGGDPSGSGGCAGGGCPVESVSWLDVQSFLQKLNDLAGEDGLYRLPTEEEWQFAARGGQAGPVQGTTANAWCKGTSGGTTHPVGEKQPNGYGLYDMVGNVAEWTASERGSLRVYRGSDWGGEEGGDCVSSSSSLARPVDRSILIGFRIVRGVGQTAPPAPAPSITTVSGTGEFVAGDGGPARAAGLDAPLGVVVDGSGNLYIADSSNHRVRRVDPAGRITTVAGTGVQGYGGDGGPATSAQLAAPVAVAVDGSGNLYIADSLNRRVRRVDTAGTITTVAGTGIQGYGGDDGAATAAQLRSPRGVAVDGSGNLYIADSYDHRVRRVDPAGTITTVAGTGVRGYSGDSGAATAAQLAAPDAVTVDSVGNLYIADIGNHRVRHVDLSGTITTVAGNGSRGFAGDGGAATAAQIDRPSGVAVDGSGNLYIADTENYRVRRVDPAGTITTVAGSGQWGYGGDGGPATAAQLAFPRDVAVDATGSLYIADLGNRRVRKVDQSGRIATVAGSGNGRYGGDGGQSVSARLREPLAVAVDTAGNLYIADSGNHRVRRVDAAGTITTVAGTGVWNYGGDGGPATAAQLAIPDGVAVDTAGNLYIADWANHRVRRVDAAGTITTVAGTGVEGYSGDGGPATVAQLAFPRGVAVDAAGNLYVADIGNHRVRRVDAAGTITTVAGTGDRGYSGDGGPTAAARLAAPWGVAVDAAGNLYIADIGSHRVRRVDAAGTITTVAGTGDRGYGGDGGPATNAQLASPSGVAVDTAGNLYIADFGNHCVRRVDGSGTITTLAGTGVSGYSGDGGPAAAAELAVPFGIAVDAVGNVYIADSFNHRVRRVTSSLAGFDPSPPPADDHANGASGATPLQLGSSVKGIIEIPGDEDWFLVETKGQWDLKFRTTGSLDLVGTLFDSSGRQLAIDELGGSDPSWALEASVPAGVYHVRVRAFQSDTGRYVIHESGEPVASATDRPAKGVITTVAGTGTGPYSGDGGPATGANLWQVSGVAVDGAGNLYIADPHVHRVRKVDSAGTITTIAGPEQLGTPHGVAVDSRGNLYIADSGNHRVYRVDVGGTITTVAGTGIAGDTGDGGPATEASLNHPAGVAVDGADNLYIADFGNHRVYRVDPDGEMTTVAGNGTRAFGGDGGPATEASLSEPFGVTVDRTGNLYIADTLNRRVRMVDLGGTITTIAGSGSFGYAGDGGAAASAELSYVYGVAADGAGNLYIADSFNHRVRRVDSSGTITTVVGSGPTGRVNGDFSGDGGPATEARLNAPRGMALDAAGNLYIADSWNLRVRKVILAGPVAPPPAPPLDDHGNDPTSATPLALNSSLAGIIETAGDEDWFRLETSERRRLKVRTTGSLDTVGTLFDLSSRQLARDDDGGSGANFALEAEVPAGVYYVRVRAFSRSDTGSYTIEENGESTGVAPPGYEPGKMYWADNAAGKIQRANLDGSGVEDLISGLDGPTDLALDQDGGKIYWLTERGEDRIQRANLDGTEVQDLVTGAGALGGLVLDLVADKIYWTSHNTGKIQRANLDGSGVEDFITGLDRPIDLAVDLDGGKIYWTISWPTAERRPGKIQRANLDGSGIEDLITEGVSSPKLALDPGAGKIYWGDWRTGKIQRADLDGSGVEDLVTRAAPSGLALDLGAGKLYWSDAFSGRVYRANLDGSGVEDLVTGLDNPLEITLDTSGDDGGEPPPVLPQPDDHGNDRSTATRLSLNASLSGAIQTAGDEDWFRLETSGQWHLKVRTTGSLDTVGTLFDVSRRQLAEDDDGGSGANFALEAEVPAGVYYVRVRAYGRSDTGSYTIEEHGEAAVSGRPNEDPGTIRTVAGAGVEGYSGDGGPATSAQLDAPFGMALDRDGNLYIADWGNHRVRRVDPAGVITTVAGTGVGGYGGDGGPATSAQLSSPVDVTVGPAGYLYIADTGNKRVRRVDRFGTITTVAGTGVRGDSGDGGPASAAKVTPYGMAVDAGGSLYIADLLFSRVRKVDAAGVITTVAGTGVKGYGGDGGPATSAQLSGPTDVAVDAAGNLYIADSTNLRVRKVDVAGVITTVAGTGAPGYGGDGGPASAATLNSPFSVAVDTVGNLYIVDRLNERVRRVDVAGVITTVAGTGVPGYGGDGGPASAALLNYPRSVAVDAVGNLYISDRGNHRVRKVTWSDPAVGPVPIPPADDHSNDRSGATRLALNSSVNGVIERSRDEDWFGLETSVQWHLKVRTTGGLDTVGTLFDASGRQIAEDDDGGSSTNFALEAEVPPGAYYVRVRGFGDADTGRYTLEEHGEAVRVAPPIEEPGTIVTVAGTGTAGYSGDGGPATSARLDNPRSVAVDTAGNVYIADNNNHRVRKVDRSGRITTVAGSDRLGYSGDGGPAIDARIRDPLGVAVDAAGNLYIAGHGRVRRVDSLGTITTVAGSGTFGPGGDGGPATEAWMRPYGVTVDSAGNLYIAERDDHRVRKVDPAGIVTTVAGTGISGYSGDGGPATSAQLSLPVEVAVDAVGNLFIADMNNYRVRKVDRTGRITTVAGTGTSGYSGDGGPATSAQMGQVTGLAVDRAGDLYIAHLGQSSIRKVDASGRISTVAGGSDDGTRRELGFLSGLAVDQEGSLYTGETNGSRVRKVTVSGGRSPGSTPKLYWTDTWADKIQRANLDGTGIVDLVYARFDQPIGLALDLSAGKIYWTASGIGKIRCANLDGSGVEDLVTGLGHPYALELGAGKIYWTEVGFPGGDRIRRANVDGTGVEDLVTRLDGPYGLVLGGGKIYWAHKGTKKIQRANVDGTGVEDLVTGLDGPYGLALGGGKIYWADRGRGKIQRANVDGTGVEDIVTEGLDGLQDGIALDLGAGKIYWTAQLDPRQRTSKIQRANLDGSGVEDFVTGLARPSSLALDREN